MLASIFLHVYSFAVEIMRSKEILPQLKTRKKKNFAPNYSFKLKMLCKDKTETISDSNRGGYTVPHHYSAHQMFDEMPKLVIHNQFHSFLVGVMDFEG